MPTEGERPCAWISHQQPSSSVTALSLTAATAQGYSGPWEAGHELPTIGNPALTVGPGTGTLGEANELDFSSVSSCGAQIERLVAPLTVTLPEPSGTAAVTQVPELGSKSVEGVRRGSGAALAPKISYRLALRATSVVVRTQLFSYSIVPRKRRKTTLLRSHRAIRRDRTRSVDGDGAERGFIRLRKEAP